MGDFEKFYNSALRFLSYRPRSEKEIRDYLKRHSGKDSERKRGGRLQNFLATEKNGRDSGHGQNDEIEYVIEKVISKIKEQKFVNDEEFAKWWIEQRTQFKPRSLRLIKVELRQKGISNEIIESGIMNYESGTRNDSKSALNLIEKRIARYKNLPKQEIYQKLGRFLASKGFDWDTIKQSIDEVLDKGV